MPLTNASVPMPGKRVTYKKAPNGTEYVYYTVRAYRNKNGKPTSDEVAIGKKDIVSGQLIPNRRYYEIFQNTKQAEVNSCVPKHVRSYGNTAALMDIAKQAGLSEILEKCFPEKWAQMMACAFYMLCEGNVMMYIEDWFDETKVSFLEHMNDMDCNKLFASITEDERRSFFINWIKFRSEQEYIVYDVSSISTYSNNIDIAEWGYNRDHDTLPQVNIGMYCGMTSHMPVYYNMYSCSIPDKSYLEFIMTDTKDLGIRDVCFVIDRGFMTEDNLHCMCKNGFSFITAMPGKRLEALRLIDENKGEIRKAVNRISEYEVYGLQCSIELYGLDFQAHIYYDPEKQAFDEKELYARIEKLQIELEKMSQSKRVAKKYKDFLLLTRKHKMY